MARPSAITLEVELTCETWTSLAAYLDVRHDIDVKDGRWQSERVADLGVLSFRLLNSTNEFTPGHASCRTGWEIGQRVRLRATVSGNTYDVFHGRLAVINPERERGLCECRVYDAMYEIMQADIPALALVEDTYAGAIVETLLIRAFHPAAEVGVAVWSDPCTTWDDVVWGSGDEGRSIDTGVSAFPWVGDRWRGSEMQVIDALRDVCDSELGYFSIQRDGYALFEDRTRRAELAYAAAAHTLTTANLVQVDDVESVRRMANEVRAMVYPRQQNNTTQVIWRSGDESNLTLPSVGEERVIHAPYRDPDQEAIRMAAWEITALVAVTDYATSPSGYESYVRIEAEYGATKAIYRITLTAAIPAGTTLDYLQQRGKTLESFTPYESVATDADLMAQQRLVSILDMPLQADPDFADQAAMYFLALRKVARDAVTVRIDGRVSSTELIEALTLDKGDRIKLTDAELGLDSYFIIEGRHTIFQQAGAGIVSYLRCTPADENQCAVWDVSEWDDGSGWGL